MVHDKHIRSRLTMLSACFLKKLRLLDNYECYSLPNPCGIVAFKHRHLPSESLAETLSETFDIAVRGGLHCAPLMHEALGTLDGGLVRVSFSHYNSIKEIDRLIFALNELAFL